MTKLSEVLLKNAIVQISSSHLIVSISVESFMNKKQVHNKLKAEI
ncbi:hypothetical protein PLUTE_a1662 [Pseudoalteromonas luteoviolacea DSM 6061]|nr:hypothetical protein [Pseudoalteromonas luteoviolacea DSM 6061]